MSHLKAMMGTGNLRSTSEPPRKKPACANWSGSLPGTQRPMRSASSGSPEPIRVAQSLAGLKPVRAGRFVIHGAHDRARPKPNDIGIEIEAALAFGTGHHGTTYGCLLALTELTKRRRFRRVLDIGTGTGVLAIAAARLMRTHVVASDIDVIAVRAAKSNARLNRAAPLVAFARAAGTGASVIAGDAPYDLILANILLGPLMRLAVPLRKLMAPGARIVLSGSLPGHAMRPSPSTARRVSFLKGAFSGKAVPRFRSGARQNKTAPGENDRSGVAGEKLVPSDDGLITLNCCVAQFKSKG